MGQRVFLFGTRHWFSEARREWNELEKSVEIKKGEELGLEITSAEERFFRKIFLKYGNPLARLTRRLFPKKAEELTARLIRWQLFSYYYRRYAASLKKAAGKHGVHPPSKKEFDKIVGDRAATAANGIHYYYHFYEQARRKGIVVVPLESIYLSSLDDRLRSEFDLGISPEERWMFRGRLIYAPREKKYVRLIKRHDLKAIAVGRGHVANLVERLKEQNIPYAYNTLAPI